MNNTPLPIVKVRLPPAEELMPRLQSVLYGGMIAEGEYSYEFEAQFAQHFGLPAVLGFSSGTAALHVALLNCDIQPGDEVITTSMTAEPTNTTILQVGAIPVFADVDIKSGNLDPQSVEASIGPLTRAIVVVHYAGYPADIKALREIADRHGLRLIEDCAHALGAKVSGHPVGTFGDASIFSFQAIKHMTTVDGGALILRNPDSYGVARRHRWFGMEKGAPRTELDITQVGYKYNMTNVAGVIGLVQLETIDEALERHRSNGRFFDQELAAIPGIEVASLAQEAEPSYWIYTLLSSNSNDVEKCLAAVGVSASKLHRPNHLHSVFAPYRRQLPGLETFYERLVHIPCGWWVSDEHRELIVNTLRRG